MLLAGDGEQGGEEEFGSVLPLDLALPQQRRSCRQGAEGAGPIFNAPVCT